MGLFERKKDGRSGSSNCLSEAEIKQKLYGEFFDAMPDKVAGSGEPLAVKRVVPVMTRTVAEDSTPDLFTEKAPESSTQTAFPVTSREIKIPVFSEKTELPKVSDKKAPVMTSHARHQEFSKLQSGVSVLPSAVTPFVKGFAEFFRTQRFLTRQVLYWAAGVLVVFFLFWAVNALNVQREQAMKTKYRAPVEKPLDAKTGTEVRVTGGVLTVSSDGQDSSSTAQKVVLSETTISSETDAGIRQSVSVAPVKPTKVFAIQVVTYPSEEYAGRIVTGLQQAGFKAFVRENVRPTGATFYIVYIGGFAAASDAQRQLAKFRAHEISRPFSDAFVRTLAMKEN